MDTPNANPEIIDDTKDKEGYSQTFVDAAVQLTLFLGQPAVERIYEFADQYSASRSEVYNNWISDMADMVCYIWRKHLEETSGNFLGLIDEYARMLREILADPETENTPEAPTWEEFQRWRLRKAVNDFFDFPEEESTKDPMDELEDAKSALVKVKNILDQWKGFEDS